MGDTVGQGGGHMHLRHLAKRSGCSAKFIDNLRERGHLPFSESDQGNWRTYNESQCQRLILLKLLHDCGMRLGSASDMVRRDLEGAISVAAVLARVQGRSPELASLSRHGLS